MTDHDILPLFVAGSLLLTLFAFFLIMYLLVQKRKQNTYQLEKQQMIFDHQSTILRTKIEEQEQTMDQISKELHDNIKSVLGYAQMSMYNIADLASGKEQVLLIEKTNKILGLVIDDLHNISHSLNSNFIINAGLAETLTKEIEFIRLQKNITCSVEIMGEAFSLGPERELHIYRIAQEVIQNCLKHAKATRLDIILSYKPHLFTMNISDNGIGFDKNKIYDVKGLGFLNIRQRARYVHGTIDLQSAPQEGSSISLAININSDGNNN